MSETNDLITDLERLALQYRRMSIAPKISQDVRIVLDLCVRELTALILKYKQGALESAQTPSVE